MKLENWYVGLTGNGNQILGGNVYGNPKFADGDRVRTSRIVGKCGPAIITKSGSAYCLGGVEAAYEAAYPNARERLFNTLPEMELSND